MSVVNLPTRRREPEPLPVIRESVTHEERAAADRLHRAAAKLHRLYGPAWATPAALAEAPDLIAKARKALEDLERSVG